MCLLMTATEATHFYFINASVVMLINKILDNLNSSLIKFASQLLIHQICHFYANVGYFYIFDLKFHFDRRTRSYHISKISIKQNIDQRNVDLKMIVIHITFTIWSHKKLDYKRIWNNQHVLFWIHAEKQYFISFK